MSSIESFSASEKAVSPFFHLLYFSFGIPPFFLPTQYESQDWTFFFHV